MHSKSQVSNHLVSKSIENSIIKDTAFYYVVKNLLLFLPELPKIFPYYP